MFDITDRRSIADRRADATREAILDAAWTLSRRDGLTGWSLRQLAKEVGLAAPTLYAYVDSKHAIYDLMFRQAWEALDELGSRWTVDPARPRETFKRLMAEWFEFSTVDLVRYQLMNQRTVPDFEPSEEAYAASLRSYERFRSQMAEIGITDQRHLDLWTAIAAGLASQQLANDPGGDRWKRLVGDAVDLFCDHVGLPDNTHDTPPEASR